MTHNNIMSAFNIVGHLCNVVSAVNMALWRWCY